MEIKDCLACKLNKKDVLKYLTWVTADDGGVCECDAPDRCQCLYDKFEDDFLEHMDTHSDVRAIQKKVSKATKELLEKEVG